MGALGGAGLPGPALSCNVTMVTKEWGIANNLLLDAKAVNLKKKKKKSAKSSCVAALSEPTVSSFVLSSYLCKLSHSLLC